MNYDVIIIGAGPGGIFAAYELMKKKRLNLKKRKARKRKNKSIE